MIAAILLCAGRVASVIVGKFQSEVMLAGRGLLGGRFTSTTTMRVANEREMDNRQLQLFALRFSDLFKLPTENFSKCIRAKTLSDGPTSTELDGAQII